MNWAVRGVACLSLIVVAGCGSGHPDVVPVTGVVTYQGNPVESAQVTFMASGAPRAGYGVTDTEGRFELSTFGQNDGALIGVHTVTIAKAATSGSDVEMSADDPSGGYEAAMRQASQGGKPESELPLKYASAETSDLTREVTKDGPNEFTLDLE